MVEPDEAAPAGVFEMWVVARRLKAAMEMTGLTVAQFASRAEVDRGLIYDVVAGRVYVNAVTLARLERVAGTRLWPAAEVKHEPSIGTPPTALEP